MSRIVIVMFIYHSSKPMDLEQAGGLSYSLTLRTEVAFASETL
jgi:hypothetical protein